MNNQVDQSQCPFCQTQNGCMAQTNNPCWCINVDIPKALIKLVPPEYKDKTCICTSCINLFIGDPDKFKAKLAE